MTFLLSERMEIERQYEIMSFFILFRYPYRNLLDPIDGVIEKYNKV